jgi:recombination protein RecA
VDRDKMLDVTLQQIEKQFGKGAVMKLGEHPAGASVSVIPTGSLALDLALGIGGVPRGRVMEVFGPEGSGKTTVCLHMIAEAQSRGGIAAFIDAEHALDPTYARELGVNIDELLVSQPDSGEQALEIADMLVRSAALDLVVIDSTRRRGRPFGAGAGWFQRDRIPRVQCLDRETRKTARPVWR